MGQLCGNLTGFTGRLMEAMSTENSTAPDGIEKADNCFLIEWTGYGPDGYEELTLNSVAAAKEKLAKYPVNWINVEACKDPLIFDQFRVAFNLHELAVEDCTTVHQRSKVEDYRSHLFIVTRMPLHMDSGETEQLGMFLGDRFVLCFQDEEGGDCLDTVRERIRKGYGDIRNHGSDYLCYAIIDAVVDAYFPVLNKLSERIDSLEDVILESDRKDISAEIHKMKREVLSLRRAVWPLRDAINTLVRDSHPFLSDTTRIYLRDCYDHIARIIDLVEMYRELTIDMMDIHLSMVNNRMNEIIKVLTVITTIFIPPTFIAGVYGMNFNPEVSKFNMPELNWFFGYFFALALMIFTSIAILALLRSKKWI
jgi:magnesium transporter